MPRGQLRDAEHPDHLARRGEEVDLPVPPGSRIGSYRIESALGAGGMGEVYLATDTRLDRAVALKFVSITADEGIRRRFRQEIRAVSSLNHPHILTVHDSGEFDGREYLVTEFVDGGTLKTWLESSQRTWRQTVELLAGVADALATAHDAGFLHRDVKPANILVAQNGYAKLADFGLAKLADAPDQETRTEPHTGAGVVVGTLDYMSPEQLKGGALDRRSDVFSFGIVLYEALAGRRPFTGETTMHVVEGIIRATPPPLSAELPAALREVVAKALEKDREDRYQSMRELVVDLRRLVRTSAEQPVAVPSISRSRWPVIAALAALAVVATGAAAWWRSTPAPGTGTRPTIHSIAVLPLENLSGDPGEEYFSDGMTEELITRLAQVRELRVISRPSVMRFKGSKKALPEIGRELGVDAILVGSTRRAEGRVRVSTQLIHASSDTHLWADDLDGDLGDVLKLQSELAKAIVREVSVQVRPDEAERLAAIPRISPAAHEAYALGRYQLASGDPAAYDKALEYFTKAVELEPGYAEAHAGLSWVWQAKRQVGGSADDPEVVTALKAAETAVRLDPSLADAHAALGGARWEAWDWTGSVQAYETALKLNPTSVDCGCYTFVLSALGRHERAIEIGRQVLDTNPLSVDALLAQGFVLFYSKRDYAEAERVLLRLLDLEPRNVIASAYLAGLYTVQKQWDKALSDKASGRPELRGSVLHARALALMGRRAEADALYRKLPAGDDVSVAIMELAFGNVDRGLAALGRAVDARRALVRWLNVVPQYEYLHGDPRFQAIVARLGFPR